MQDGLCLVFGASGYIGTNLVERLRRDGRRVRAAARNRKVLEAREWIGVELVQADALDAASLPADVSVQGGGCISSLSGFTLGEIRGPLSLPPGAFNAGVSTRFIARSCTNCHNSIHGSDAPGRRGIYLFR
mgnify:CR=1 FL=1